jgi:hypothetical protein
MSRAVIDEHEPGPRPAPRTVALAIVGVAMIASAIVLAYWGRGQTFSGDELAYASRLSEQSLAHAMFEPPAHAYLIAAAMFVYKLLFEAIGLGSYAPYRGVAIALGLLCAGLFYLLARRRVGDILAVPPTLIPLFFGFAAGEVLTAARLPGLMAVAAGLGTLLVLTPKSRHGDLAAVVLLTISVASHPSGLAFVPAAAVLVLLRPPPERWRSAWIFLVPTLLYAAWWVTLRPSGNPPMQTNLGKLASFVGQSWTAATAAVSGVAGVIDGSAYHHVLGWLAGGLLFTLVVAVVATRARRLPPSFWAAAAALLTLWITTALTRSTFIEIAARPADSGRYLYPAGILLLLVLVELAGAVRLPGWGAWAATGVLALGLVANLDRLHDAADEQRPLTQRVRASFGAVEIAAGVVQPEYRPLGLFYPTAGQYLDASHAFGSLAYSPEELTGSPPPVTAAADTVLVGAMRLGLQPARETSSNGTQPPRVAAALQGAAEAAHGCVELRPTAGASAFAPQPSVLPPPRVEGSASPPALAEVTLSAGGVSLAADRLAEVGLRLGRFAVAPTLPLRMPQAGRVASLAIPEDGVALPWKLVVYSRRPVTLCGLGAVDTT